MLLWIHLDHNMQSAGNDKTVGILGGMGPEATVDLMQRIITLTPATDDIDHIHCLIDNNPKIPSRIKALIDQDGTNPEPCLIAMARGLEQSGADFLAIACNTAHYYFKAIENAVDIPVINMIDEVLLTLLNHNKPQQIAVLASTAVQITKLYENKFAAANIEVIYPDPEQQNQLFNIIKAVKAGKTGIEVVQSYQDIADHLKTKNIDTAIVACTELSTLNIDSNITLIDAADILAKAIIKTAKS